MGQFYTTNQKMEKPICTDCGYGGHAINKCCKLYGYPPEYKTKQKSSATCQIGPSSSNQTGYNTSLNNAMANQVSDSIPDQTIDNVENFVQKLNPDQYQHLLNFPGHWGLDSGATRHVCFNHASCQTLKKVQNAYITLPNHTKIPVNFAGNVELNLELIFEDVLFAPQFKFNLLSISSLARNSNVSIRFLINYCYIQDLCSLKMIDGGKRVYGLYIIDAANAKMNVIHSKLSVTLLIFLVNNNSHVWHHRLGHLSFKSLETLKNQLHFKNERINTTPHYISPPTKQRMCHSSQTTIYLLMLLILFIVTLGVHIALATSFFSH